jgi:hypothetical protein
MYLDPGGSKTCGSGSPTLLKRPGSLFKNPFSVKSRIQNTGKGKKVLLLMAKTS